MSMVCGASVDNLCLSSIFFTSLICEMSNIQLPYRYYDIQSDQSFQKIQITIGYLSIMNKKTNAMNQKLSYL
jgi:hypothetical protein